MADEEQYSEEAPRTTHLCVAANVRHTDDKGPEDIHQHIRDATRSRRHKHIPMSGVFECQRMSGVLEARGVNATRVDPDTVAAVGWQAASTKAATKMSYKAAPEDSPDWLKHILSPKRHWPSPTVPTQCESLLARSCRR